MTSSRWVVLIVSLIGSAVMGIVLLFLAAMADGMSHNSKSMYTLFPYGIQDGIEEFGSTPQMSDMLACRS